MEPTESALLEAPVPSAAPDTPSQEEGVKEPPEHDEPIRSPRKPMHLVGGKGSPEELHLPPGYVLDRSDPDVWVLHCPQGAPVARFSAQGATAEAIEREARAHHKERNRSA